MGIAVPKICPRKRPCRREGLFHYAELPVHSSMAAVIFGIWALMTAVAAVDVVNPAKGLLAGQDLWTEIGVPSRPGGLALSWDHPASGSGWSARAYLRRSATGIKTRLPIRLVGRR